MRADHHHVPVTVPGLLLEKARIKSHLRFQLRRRQIAAECSQRSRTTPSMNFPG